MVVTVFSEDLIANVHKNRDHWGQVVFALSLSMFCGVARLKTWLLKQGNTKKKAVEFFASRVAYEAAENHCVALLVRTEKVMTDINRTPPWQQHNVATRS